MEQISAENVRYSEVTSARSAFILSLKSAINVLWGLTIGVLNAQMDEINNPSTINRTTDGRTVEIGRASCRERVSSPV